MPEDIRIIVLGQEQAVDIPFQTGFVVGNEHDDLNARRYETHRPFTMLLPGIQYALYQQNHDSIVQWEDRPLNLSAWKRPLWITGAMWNTLQWRFVLDDRFIDDFKHVLHFLLDSSPLGMAAFYSRIMDEEDDIIVGPMEIDVFFYLLEKKEVSYNTCYILTKKPRASLRNAIATFEDIPVSWPKYPQRGNGMYLLHKQTIPSQNGELFRFSIIDWRNNQEVFQCSEVFPMRYNSYLLWSDDINDPDVVWLYPGDGRLLYWKSENGGWVKSIYQPCTQSPTVPTVLMELCPELRETTPSDDSDEKIVKNKKI